MELEPKNAFVLHGRPFKENQMILEMLVEGEGRISVIASKGGKKNSARTALLQPFRPVVIQFKKDSGLRSLKNIEAQTDFQIGELKLSGKALFCGFYLNEVICRLCKSDAYYDDLYPLYVYALSHLQQNQQLTDFDYHQPYLELTLRQFEHRLLVMLGYGLSFDSDLETQQGIHAEQYYELHSDIGFVASLYPQRAILGQDIQALERLLERDLDDKLLERFAEYVTPNTLKIAKYVLRTCLHRHLGDKPLKSRELFRK